MAKRTSRTMTRTQMQDKANTVLRQAIKRIEHLGFSPYDIESNVRITTNSRRIGSCSDINRSFYRVSRGQYAPRPGTFPLMRVSVSIKAFENEKSLESVIYHEVIHACPGCFNHGRNFKAIGKKIGEKYGIVITTYYESDTDSREKPSKAQPAKKRVIRSSDNDKKRIREMIGKVFVHNGRRFRIDGINERAPKNCVNLTCISNGREYRSTPRFVFDRI